MTPFDAVHAAKDNVTLRGGEDCFARGKIPLERKHRSAKAHLFDGPGENVNFGFSDIVSCRVYDAIQILLFDEFRIDENELADSEPGELLNDNASGAGASDNCC